MLSCFVNKDLNNWDDLLPHTVFSYNNAIHSSTSFAPNEKIFGKILESPTDRKLGVENDAHSNREKILDTASRKIENAQRNQNASHDKNVKQTPYFLPDDEVMLYNNR